MTREESILREIKILKILSERVDDLRKELYDTVLSPLEIEFEIGESDFLDDSSIDEAQEQIGLILSERRLLLAEIRGE